MAQNKYRVETDQCEIRVLEVNENSVILVNQTLMSKQMDALSKLVQAISMRQSSSSTNLSSTDSTNTSFEMRVLW